MKIEKCGYFGRKCAHFDVGKVIRTVNDGNLTGLDKELEGCLRWYRGAANRPKSALAEMASEMEACLGCARGKSKRKPLKDKRAAKREIRQ